MSKHAYLNPNYHRDYRASHVEQTRATRAVYNQTPERQEAQRARNQQKRAELRAWCDSLKMAPCTDCRSEFMPYVMEWDHLPGSVKMGDVGKMAANKWSKKRILEEIAKCELVCANCHRERTYRRRLSAGLGEMPELVLP